MTVSCKFCLNQSTCLCVGKLPECPAFSRWICGCCLRYTSVKECSDAHTGVCDIEGEHITIYPSDPACEHFKVSR